MLDSLELELEGLPAVYQLIQIAIVLGVAAEPGALSRPQRRRLMLLLLQLLDPLSQSQVHLRYLRVVVFHYPLGHSDLAIEDFLDRGCLLRGAFGAEFRDLMITKNYISQVALFPRSHVLHRLDRLDRHRFQGTIHQNFFTLLLLASQKLSSLAGPIKLVYLDSRQSFLFFLGRLGLGLDELTDSLLEAFLV